MTDVLKMTYADIKTVKTRGVCQVVLEMPIEGMPDAFALLGAPVPGNEVWVAVARLRTGAETVPAAIEPPVKRGTLAQQAGILCDEPAFWKWLGVNGSDSAATKLRDYLGIGSRRDLDTNADAAAKFRELRAGYQLWMKDVA